MRDGGKTVAIGRLRLLTRRQMRDLQLRFVAATLELFGTDAFLFKERREDRFRFGEGRLTRLPIGRCELTATGLPLLP